ncbi:Rossmann fold domain-containing protein [Novosphingobium sp. TH158]|uniref:Rossmann fold domain-containing protein n=1 Tax=Novosphingobium sp. TH158 TaxID=2067455 RepID=UPI000C7D96A4|nr:hypothetical protein [Novosphingobium sp. TH158]PLK26577.1 hypothetical protein C0V78_06480 [Novosphingobium sp. TH158]
MLVRIGPLPDGALDAASAFHAAELPRLRSMADPVVTFLFAPADHTHTAWRRAAVQSLARELAPRRINAIASDDESAIEAALAYLAAADGVTGQYLALDSAGAGKVIE